MKRKFYSVLYVAIFALLMSGCSMSEIADGSRSAVKGYEKETVEDTSESENTTAAEKKDNTGNTSPESSAAASENIADQQASSMEIADIPIYSGETYCEINGNVPYFSEDEMVTEAFENYSDLDFLGRCGVAYANICKEIMPTEERGEIGMIKPSGWHTVKYNDRIDGNYLYNRCHLIGYQLAGENANPKNLITGTRYLNVEGMLPFENLVADYVNNTGNHVLYRVTPMFSGSNLVANGVLIEAKSVEDNGGGILFNVYCYNVQPGVGINYENGDSWLEGTAPQEQSAQTGAAQNGGSQSSDGSSAGASAGDTGSSGGTTGSASSGSDSSVAENSAADSSNSKTMVHITATGKKYHRAGCRTLKKSDTEVTLDEAKSMGLSPCGICNPPQ